MLMASMPQMLTSSGITVRVYSNDLDDLRETADAVADVLMGKVCCKFRKIGVNDQFGQSGKAADVLREYGLTADQIAAKIKETL